MAETDKKLFITVTKSPPGGPTELNVDLIIMLKRIAASPNATTIITTTNLSGFTVQHTMESLLASIEAKEGKKKAKRFLSVKEYGTDTILAFNLNWLVDIETISGESGCHITTANLQSSVRIETTKNLILKELDLLGAI